MDKFYFFVFCKYVDDCRFSERLFKKADIETLEDLLMVDERTLNNIEKYYSNSPHQLTDKEKNFFLNLEGDVFKFPPGVKKRILYFVQMIRTYGIDKLNDTKFVSNFLKGQGISVSNEILQLCDQDIIENGQRSIRDKLARFINKKNNDIVIDLTEDDPIKLEDILPEDNETCPETSIPKEVPHIANNSPIKQNNVSFQSINNNIKYHEENRNSNCRVNLNDIPLSSNHVPKSIPKNSHDSRQDNKSTPSRASKRTNNFSVSYEENEKKRPRKTKENLLNTSTPRIEKSINHEENLKLSDNTPKKKSKNQRHTISNADISYTTSQNTISDNMSNSKRKLCTINSYRSNLLQNENRSPLTNMHIESLTPSSNTQTTSTPKRKKRKTKHEIPSPHYLTPDKQDYSHSTNSNIDDFKRPNKQCSSNLQTNSCQKSKKQNSKSKHKEHSNETLNPYHIFGPVIMKPTIISKLIYNIEEKMRRSFMNCNLQHKKDFRLNLQHEYAIYYCLICTAQTKVQFDLNEKLGFESICEHLKSHFQIQDDLSSKSNNQLLLSEEPSFFLKSKSRKSTNF